MDSLWPFIPQVAMKERCTYSTEVIRGKTAEQRIRRRYTPRTSLEFTYNFNAQEIEAAVNKKRAFDEGPYYVPFWQDKDLSPAVSAGVSQVAVSTATSRYKVGDFIFLISATGNQYELKAVTSISTDLIQLSSDIGIINKPFYAMPCYLGYMPGALDVNKFSGLYTVASCTFELAKDFSITGASPYPTFESIPMVTDRPVISGNMASRYVREVEQFSNIDGPLTYYQEYGQSVVASQATWALDNKADVSRLRDWFYYTAGKQKAFMLPSWEHDFILYESITSGAFSCKVYKNQWDDNDYAGPAAFVLKDGSVIAVTVSNMVQNQAFDVMNITDTFPSDISLDAVDMITRMTKSRFDSDVMEFNYNSAGVVTVDMPVIEVPDAL
jgi:hypothetical protein